MLVTLISLSEVGAENRVDPLFGYTRAARLLTLHREVAAGAKLNDKELLWETYDSGVLDLELGKMAASHGDYAVAAKHFAAAAARAEECGDTSLLANRLSDLRIALEKQGQYEEAESVVGRLRALVASGGLEPRGRVVAQRALAAHLTDTDPDQAVCYIEDAVAAAEEIRGQITDISRRADTDRQFHDVYPRLAMLLRAPGMPSGLSRRFRLGKGRALLDAAQVRGQGAGRPPDLATVRAVLAHRTLSWISPSSRMGLSPMSSRTLA